MGSDDCHILNLLRGVLRKFLVCWCNSTVGISSVTATLRIPISNLFTTGRVAFCSFILYVLKLQFFGFLWVFLVGWFWFFLFWWGFVCVCVGGGCFLLVFLFFFKVIFAEWSYQELFFLLCKIIQIICLHMGSVTVSLIFTEIFWIFLKIHSRIAFLHCWRELLETYRFSWCSMKHKWLRWCLYYLITHTLIFWLRSSQACVLGLPERLWKLEGSRGVFCGKLPESPAVSDGANAMGLQDGPATDPPATVGVPLR